MLLKCAKAKTHVYSGCTVFTFKRDALSDLWVLPNSQGLFLDVSSDKGSFLPEKSRINFIVPSENSLRNETELYTWKEGFNDKHIIS